MELPLREQVLEAWVGMTATIKNNRMTAGLTYNEAIVLMYMYGAYRKDGVGEMPVKDLVAKTRMLKSLVNRTVDGLEEQGFVTKSKGAKDARTVVVRLEPARLRDFMEVHENSLKIVDTIIEIIGEEDATTFVRIYEKIAAKGL